MGWIFDIAVVALAIIAAVIGAKKGFFRACFDFCGALIAMIAAGLLSSPVAEWIFTTFFRPSLVEKISAAVMGLGAGDAVNTVFDAFPELIQRALEAAGITQGSIMAQVQDKTDSIAEAITDALSPMLINVIGVFVMLVLFVLFIVVLRGVATLLTGVFSLPVLSGINGALGAVFDVLMLVLILWVVLACTQVFVPMLSAAQQVKVQAFENTSMLLKLLGSFNPAYHLMQ